MNFFHNMKIGTKLVAGFSLIIVMLISSLIYVLTLLSACGTKGEELYTNYGNTQGDVGLAYADFQLVKVSLRNALYLYADDQTKRDSAVSAMDAAEESAEKYIEAALEAMTDDECRKLLEEAHTYVDEYLSDAKQSISLLKAGQTEEARAYLMEHGVDSANNAQAKIEELSKVLDEKAAARLEEMEKSETTSIIIIVCTIVVDFLVALFIALAITKSIRRPLIEMSKVAKELSIGDVDVNVTYQSDNELGDLADSFRATIDNVREQAQVLRQISQGDLTIDYVPKSSMDVMGNAIEALVRDNNRVFQMIREGSVQVSTGAEEVAAASQALAQGSTEQAGAIEQITASISDIAERIKSSASHANEANRLVSEAKLEAEDGNRQMTEMIEAMQQINEASENISKIIKVIDDIAFQTNILALNAAVEAARAGSQGKGFAVVAEEVRSLAGKSAQAASETAEMIEDSIVKVSRGSKLAQETADALRNISKAVEQSVELVEKIATSSNEEATAVAQIDIGISQVSQVVQTNSATSQQCASASEELSNQAIALRQELASFRLKEGIGQNNYGGYLGSSQASQAPRYQEPMTESNESIISLDGGYGKY